MRRDVTFNMEGVFIVLRRNINFVYYCPSITNSPSGIVKLLNICREVRNVAVEV